MKRFSFVIPTFNKGQLLRNTLECLNTQNGYGRDDYEVIVVDDGSTNNEFDLIKDMPRNFDMKYIYLDRNSDSCRSKTRNEGWKNAGGKIITFLDADVLIDNNFLSEIDRCFSIDSNISISSNIIWTNHEVAFEDVKSGEIFNKYAFTKDRIDIMEERHYIFSRYSYNPAALNMPWLLSYSGNLSVSRKSIEKVGGFDEKFKGWGAEDNDFGYRLHKAGVKVIVNSKILSVHQFHGQKSDVLLSKEKRAERDKNIDYFASKHPELRDVIELFKVLDTVERERFMEMFRLPNLAQNIRTELIRFKDIDMIEDVKCSISAELYGNEDVEIIVEDYVEATDLDLWVQLLETSNGVIRYYPMSKKLNDAQVREHLINIGNIS